MSDDIQGGLVRNVWPVSLGDMLQGDHTLGATTLQLDDASDFDEDGGQVRINGTIYTYTAVDQDESSPTADQMTLLTGLVQAELDTTEVRLYNPYRGGENIEYRAAIELFQPLENDEPLEAILDHGMIDKLPQGVRETGAEESVNVTYRSKEGEWFVTNIIGEELLVDGSYINPGSLPATPIIPDGLPPNQVTQVVAIGGKGFISVRWGGVTNADNFPVRYELHMSEDPSFTASFNDPDTLVLDTNANMATVDKIPPMSEPLIYFESDGVTPHLYYFAVIAYQAEDGPALPSPTVSAPMNQTVEADIAVRSITGQLFSAEVVLSSMFSSPSLTGARIQIGIGSDDDSAKITAYDATEQPTAQINTDGSPHFFKGEATLDVATIIEAILAGTGHALTPGSTLTLTGATQAPSQQPTVSGDNWATQTLDTDPFNDLKRGLAYRSSNAHLYYALRGFGPFPVQSSVKEVDASGTDIATYLIDDGIFAEGIAFDGTDFWVIGEDQSVSASSTQRWIIGRYNTSFVLQNSWQAIMTQNIAEGSTPGFGWDATASRLMVLYSTSSGRWRIDKYQGFTTGSLHTPDSTLLSDNSYSADENLDFAAVFRGSFDLGTDRHIMVCRNTAGNQGNVRVMNVSTDADVSNEYWPIANGAALAGMTYNSTLGQFVHLSINSSLGNIVTYSKNFWTTQSNKWWIKTTLYDGTHETDPSPAKSLTMTKRGRLVVAADIPLGDANQIRVYVGRGSTVPANSAMFRQTDPGVGNNLSAKYDLVDFAAASTLATARTAFPAGTPSKIDTAAGTELTSEGDITVTGGGVLTIGGANGDPITVLSYGRLTSAVAGGNGQASYAHGLGTTPLVVIGLPTLANSGREARRAPGQDTSSVFSVQFRDSAGNLVPNGTDCTFEFVAIA